MRVLIVDDNNDIIDVLRRALAIGEHEVIIARNGSDALYLESLHTPDVVISDVNLPDMDGWEICRRLKARRNVPVMLLTVRAEEADRLRSQQAGADAHLPKPFDVIDLLQRVDRLGALR